MIWTYDEGRHAGGRCDVRWMILSPNRSSPKKKYYVTSGFIFVITIVIHPSWSWQTAAPP